MSTVPAALVAMVVLAVAGAAPALAVAGLRWVTVPLAPLAGAVVAGVAATAYLATGGSFLLWFGLVAGVAAAVVAGVWMVRGDTRPGRSGARAAARERWLAATCVVLVVAVTAWSLRGLRSPTVGFDARAIWLSRSGWFLQSHHQLVVHMKAPGLVLVQSAYPPMLSAANSVAWGVTGNHTLRLGVVVVALLNACALVTACLGVVEAGMRSGRRLGGGAGCAPAWGPAVAGVAAAVVLVPVACGITEPFLTNGYADPLWSLAAVGAVVFGLQVGTERWTRGVAAVLVLACGLTKFEGVYTALCLIGLFALRAVASVVRHRRGHPAADATVPRRVVPALVVAVLEAVAILSWTVLIRVLHARGDTNPTSPWGDAPARARATFHGMAPYLHVLVVALPVAVVGGLVLGAARRRQGLGNDVWAWSGLAAGTLVVGGALVRGTAPIKGWLETTVHRVTEFSALAGWWILAVWAVAAAGAVWEAARPRSATSASPAGAGTGPAGGDPVGAADTVDTVDSDTVDGAGPAPAVPDRRRAPVGR